MIDVDLIGLIRRAYFEQHRPIKEIVRRLSVSRATVRKVIRGETTEFKYERDVQPAPKLGEWIGILTEILEQEAKLPRRERRSTQRLFEELRGRGYDGAHDSVHRFAKAWRTEQTRVAVKAYVPLSFAPGEAYQFDWSHETITLAGLPLMIKAAHMKLSHSRMPFVRTYFRETQELVCDEIRPSCLDIALQRKAMPQLLALPYVGEPADHIGIAGKEIPQSRGVDVRGNFEKRRRCDQRQQKAILRHLPLVNLRIGDIIGRPGAIGKGRRLCGFHVRYLKEGSCSSASLVAPRNIMRLSPISSELKGTMTYLLSMPRNPPTESTA